MSSTSSSASPLSNTVPVGAAYKGTSKTSTTTERTIILAQIRGLQKQLGEVTKQLQAVAGASDPASIELSIELEHEIEGIQEEIRALQNELLQKSADQKVQVSAGKDDGKSGDTPSSALSSLAASLSPTSSSSSSSAPAASSVATVGSVIDTQA